MTDRTFDVKGRCPACGGTSLFLGSGGYVTCSRLDCPQPDAASSVLEGGAEDDEPAPCKGCGEPWHKRHTCAARTTPDDPKAWLKPEWIARLSTPDDDRSQINETVSGGRRLAARTAADNPATSDDGLRDLYAAAIRAKVDGTEGCANAHRLADAVLAVRDSRMEQLKAERDMLGRDADRLRRDWTTMRDRAEQAERALHRMRDDWRRSYWAWRSARKRARVLSDELTRRAPLTGQYAAAIARVRALRDLARDVKPEALGPTWEALDAALDGPAPNHNDTTTEA